MALAIGLPFTRLRGIALADGDLRIPGHRHVVALNWQPSPAAGRRWSACRAIPISGWRLPGQHRSPWSSALPISQTRHGLALRCSRESEVAAAATGIDVERERLIAFVLSAIDRRHGRRIVRHFLGTMTASTFYLDLTFVTLTMLVVGGMRSLTGACAGVALVSIVSELFRTIERGIACRRLHVLSAPPGLQEIALALILLAILGDAAAWAWSVDWELSLGASRQKSKGESEMFVACIDIGGTFTDLVLYQPRIRSGDLQIADHAGRVRAGLHQRARRCGRQPQAVPRRFPGQDRSRSSTARRCRPTRWSRARWRRRA